MDDCTGYIGLCHACAYAGLHDAGIYAGYADNRNSKELVTVRKKKAICGIWAGFLAMPVAAFLIRYLSSSLAEYYPVYRLFFQVVEKRIISPECCTHSGSRING